MDGARGLHRRQQRAGRFIAVRLAKSVSRVLQQAKQLRGVGQLHEEPDNAFKRRAVGQLHRLAHLVELRGGVFFARHGKRGAIDDLRAQHAERLVHPVLDARQREGEPLHVAEPRDGVESEQLVQSDGRRRRLRHNGLANRGRGVETVGGL